MTYRIDTLRLAKPKCGRGLQRLRRQGTAGTGPVVNNDGATKNFRSPVEQQTHGDVGRLTGWKGNDEANRLHRKALTTGGQGWGDQSSHGELDKLTTFQGDTRRF